MGKLVALALQHIHFTNQWAELPGFIAVNIVEYFTAFIQHHSLVGLVVCTFFSSRASILYIRDSLDTQYMIIQIKMISL